MPIRPENKARYPKDWKEISLAVREAAGDKCEGSPDFPDCRAANGEPHPETGSKVVLTVAHLDHTPEHCERANLKAWCQRCHLNYDKEHHAKTAYRTRMEMANTRDIFEALLPDPNRLVCASTCMAAKFDGLACECYPQARRKVRT